jgi:hypothetical protein
VPSVNSISEGPPLKSLLLAVLFLGVMAPASQPAVAEQDMFSPAVSRDFGLAYMRYYSVDAYMRYY